MRVIPTKGDPMTEFPSSKRVYVRGVPFREISTKDNQSLRVYDTRGPWGDPDIRCEVQTGLPPVREPWILERGDSVEYEGRNLKPEDNGYLSDKHAEQSQGRNRLEFFPGIRRRPRKALNGGAVTQIHYARKGIVTPEMEFVATRENLGRERAFEAARKRTDVRFQHKGE